MKKRITPVLLIILMVFTLSACGIIDVTPSTPASLPSSAPPEAIEPTVAPTEFTEPIETIPNFKVKTLNPDFVNQLNFQELSLLADEMLKLSLEDLSYDDMLQMGHNFDYIVSANPKSNYLMSIAFKSLCNVVDYSKRQGISLYYLYSWANIPAKDVIFQCYYFVSENSIWGCDGIYLLEKDDAFVVAKAFLHNDYLANDYLGILDILNCKYSDVQKLGLNRLLEISTQKEIFPYTRSLCEQIKDNTCTNSVLTAKKLQKIRDNIMVNTFFDFVDKYTVFCNSPDSNLSAQAFNRLLEIAKVSNADTAHDIRIIANNLYDLEMANQLLNALEKSY